MSKSKRLDNPAREPLPGQTSFLAEQRVIVVPIGEFPEGAYVTTHVEVQLDAEQASSLKRIVTGLDESGARLKNGRRVASHADAVKYMLESLSSFETLTLSEPSGRRAA